METLSQILIFEFCFKNRGSDTSHLDALNRQRELRRNQTCKLSHILVISYFAVADDDDVLGDDELPDYLK